jgi:hypothetical protein
MVEGEQRTSGETAAHQRLRKISVVQEVIDGVTALIDLDGICQSGLLYESWEDHTAWQSGMSSLGRCRSVLPVRLNRREMAFSLVEGAFNDGKGEQGAHE